MVSYKMVLMKESQLKGPAYKYTRTKWFPAGMMQASDIRICKPSSLIYHMETKAVIHYSATLLFMLDIISM